MWIMWWKLMTQECGGTKHLKWPVSLPGWMPEYCANKTPYMWWVGPDDLVLRQSSWREASWRNPPASKNRAEQTQQVVFHEQTKNLFAIPMLLLKYPLIEEQLEIIKIPKSSENLRVRMWHFSKLCSDAACGEKATEMLSIPLAEMDRF